MKALLFIGAYVVIGIACSVTYMVIYDEGIDDSFAAHLILLWPILVPITVLMTATGWLGEQAKKLVTRIKTP